MGLYLSSSTPQNTLGVENPVRLQQYLPPANTVERGFKAFTAFDKDTKIFTTVAADFPTPHTMTIWTSSISGSDVSSVKATPVLNGVKVAYPAASSPAPLDFVPLKLSQIVNAPNGALLAVFTNGEVHSLDVEGGKLTLLHKLISDEKALSVDNPTTYGSHTFDFDRNGLWSVVSAGMYAYVVFTDFKTGTVGEWRQLDANMKMDPGKEAVTTDFSPEWFINAFIADFNDGNGNQLMVELQSVSDDIGFDLMTFVNTTSGLLTGPVYNMMNYNIVLQCKSYQCDTDRTSTFDPVGKTVYFQGHSMASGQQGTLTLSALAPQTLPNGKPSYYVTTTNPALPNGHAGFQYYNF